MDTQLLAATLAKHDQPPFRAAQVWRWMAAGAGGYGEMTNIPRSLRETLAREVPFSNLTLRREARARDGTVKALFATHDGRPLEAVLMRYRDPPGGGEGGDQPGGVGRRSLCLSSQSGCPLTCTFCATGRMKFARNLTTSEILDQALHFRRMSPFPGPEAPSRSRAANGSVPAPISHCVFMGMGEPLLNLDAVLAACERLPDIGIAHRRTTISTVGWIPGIERLAECELPLRLALSLHAADEALRSELMPVNKRYPLRDVLEACRAHYARKRRRIFVEYVMLAGVNDRYEQAVALARLLRGGPERPQVFKVNLIPFNPSGGRPTPDSRLGSGMRASEMGGADVTDVAVYRGSSREAIAAFKAAIEEHGVRATVRLTRGRDIDAACGQLAARAA